MNDMFTFERADWELLLDSLEPGSTLSALRLLTVLEHGDEAVADEVLNALLDKRITLDISRLPKDYGSGEMEKSLRREENLARSGDLLNALDASDALRLYLEELGRTPAQGDPVLLAQHILGGDETAGQKLVNLYLHRVVDIAKEYTGRGLLLLDLMQEGNLGLWNGILQYTGGDFEAHIDWWIRQTICRQILLQARENGVLRNMQLHMEAYRQADQRLLTQLGRNATVEEIALELSIDAEQANVVHDLIQTAAAMEKAKKPVPDEEPEEQQAVEDTAYFQSRQRIAELLSTLSETEEQVLSLRFGLENGVPASPETVGEELGMSPDAVVAMEAAALAKLRNE